MARQRDPRRDQAREIWMKSNGEKLLKDIAEELGVSDSQIRKWKSQDKWAEELKGNVTNAKSNVTNRGGAPPGNQNAKGNKGNKQASPPSGNKNALKTGEYETIFADYLTEEEKDLYSNLNDDPFFVMSEEVRLLKIRQRRMMKRIADAEAGLNERELEKLYELRGRKTLVESKKSGQKIQVEVPDLVLTEMKEHSFRKIEDVLSIEEALTRVSAQLQRAVKQMNEIILNENRRTLLDRQSEKLDVEIRRLKMQIDDLDPEEIEDDGFLAALEAEGEELWPEE
ncbi:phage terminase small subunit [Enterococcus gallinarum]|uniref:Phage terminase small subunit n=1 Tax=Enterococcus gallinarum TaxID=1353 RepID=A0A376H1U7_ENTGA|nr:phage terminase small subunit [Enterococcus gallinarum]STD84273.1 Phage terminase small subunit [Enterococcus gallinarum]STD85867.1 Phage terminase small subunit [Enterococcus gallinarum]